MTNIMNEPEFCEALSMLSEVIQDLNISKNIRLAADNCVRILNDNLTELPIRCDKAIQVLSITDDPNIDMYTKTLIWQVVSLLESHI